MAQARSLLDEITDYCRRVGMAESTFGRRAVNDGKLVNRLRFGGRVTTETADRIRSYIGSDSNIGSDLRSFRGAGPRPSGLESERGEDESMRVASMPAAAEANPASTALETVAEENFRFYDNRQKYLLFVNTCSEKTVVAQRVAMELGNVHPRPPALRVFDAGVGDGTVLSKAMRSMHHRFPTMPFYIAGKEISLEDVRLALEKMPDRFYEHPSTVLVLTNMLYSEAPWLTPKSVTAASSMVWQEVALAGNTAAEFDEQITQLEPFLGEHWQTRNSAKTGNPIYEKPVVLVIYREDYRFLLDSVIPRRGAVTADYDLVVASQPYRARSPAEFKARNVVVPLAKSLGRGGRLIGIHSYGGDPGLEIVQKVWPDDNPFVTSRHDILKQTKAILGSEARNLNFNAYSDQRALFHYEMHTLPGEIEGDAGIGTSTLFAAWNDAVYVAQIEDQRLEEALKHSEYLEGTREVLRKYGKLWFWDESYVISRKRD